MLPTPTTRGVRAALLLPLALLATLAASPALAQGAIAGQITDAASEFTLPSLSLIHI